MLMKTIIQKRSMDVNAKTCRQPYSGRVGMADFLLMDYIAEVPGSVVDWADRCRKWKSISMKGAGTLTASC